MNQIIRPSDRRFGWDLFGDLDDFVNQVFRAPRVASGEGERANAPAIDVKETDAAYIVHAELPGVKKDDLNISISDGVLTINAETRFESEEKDAGRVIRQERRYGKFVRSMRLGNDVDEAQVSADYTDGVLNVTLPKTEEVKPKRIEVRVS